MICISLKKNRILDITYRAVHHLILTHLFHVVSYHCLIFSATTLQPHWFPFGTLNKLIPAPSQGLLIAWVSLYIAASHVQQLSWISFQKSILVLTLAAHILKLE